MANSPTPQPGAAPRPTAAPSGTGGGRPASDHDLVNGTARVQAAPAKKAPAKKAAPRKAAPGRTSVPQGQFTMDSFLAALRAQESGDYSARPHGASSASGAYQYLDGTWDNYGGYKHAYQAPREVQDRRAREDAERHFKQFGGDWRKVAAAHFAGAGWVNAHPDPSTWGQNPAPGSKNPTVTRYVTSLFSKAGANPSLPSGGGPTGATPSTAGVRTSGGTTTFSSPAALRAEVEKNYGYLAGFLDDKELGPILTQAAKEGWDASRLQGALYETKFYKDHSATTRRWDAQTKLDPATQKASVAAQVSNLAAQARKSGLSFQPGRLAVIAVNSLRFGWSAQRATDALLSEGKLDISGKKPNSAATSASDLRQRAAQYLVPISDPAMQKWVKQIVSGDISEADFDAYLKEQAKSLFPTLSAAIDRGVTVEQYADPYRQQAAQLLEVDPQSIDFMKNPVYQKALFQKDPKTGDNTSMSLADWSTYLRKTPGFAKTHQANQQAAQFGNTLAEVFGKIAT